MSIIDGQAYCQYCRLPLSWETEPYHKDCKIIMDNESVIMDSASNGMLVFDDVADWNFSQYSPEMRERIRTLTSLIAADIEKDFLLGSMSVDTNSGIDEKRIIISTPRQHGKRAVADFWRRMIESENVGFSVGGRVVDAKIEFTHVGLTDNTLNIEANATFQPYFNEIEATLVFHDGRKEKKTKSKSDKPKKRKLSIAEKKRKKEDKKMRKIRWA